jgi:hypothetical protein
MKSTSVLSSIALGSALAAACGGISTVGNKLAEDDAGEPMQESGVVPRSDSGAARPDAAMPGMPMFNVSCQSAQSCPRSQVCCAMLSLAGGGGGLDVACASSCGPGGFQVCATSAECTTRGEVCTASPVGFGGICMAARDGGPRPLIDSGAIEDGNAHDSSAIEDGNAHDSSVAIEDGNAHDGDLVGDAPVAVEAGGGNDAASGDGGASDEAASADDGAADDDSSDTDGGS